MRKTVKKQIFNIKRLLANAEKLSQNQKNYSKLARATS